MTQQEFYKNLGYLTNLIRGTLIEVEMPPKRKNTFIPQYAEATNNYPLPQNTTTSPYYVYDDNVNKFGLESRIYFDSNQNLPQSLFNILEPRKNQNRPGYEEFKCRISNNDFVFKLFEHGFILGRNQDETRIRTLVPEIYLENFNEGYAL